MAVGVVVGGAFKSIVDSLVADIIMETRKGVALSYAPEQAAV